MPHSPRNRADVRTFRGRPIFAFNKRHEMDKASVLAAVEEVVMRDHLIASAGYPEGVYKIWCRAVARIALPLPLPDHFPGA